MLHAKWQQLAVIALRSGVPADQWLSIEILQRVRHQAVLAEGHNRIIGAEHEIREHRALDDLHTPDFGKRLLRFTNCLLIGGVLAFVVGKICAQVANIEFRLLLCGKARAQIGESGGPHDEEDFVFCQAIHSPLSPLACSSSRRSSGEMLSWPILSALPAISWKATAMSCSGFMPLLASACRMRGSASPSARMVTETP